MVKYIHSNDRFVRTLNSMLFHSGFGLRIFVVCVRACVRACVRVCVRVCVCVYACVRTCM